MARVTHGIIAPGERSFTIVGDEGVLYTNESQGYASPVALYRTVNRLSPWNWRRVLRGVINRTIMRIPGMVGPVKFDQPVKLARKSAFKYGRRMQRVDRCRGISELADAIETGRPCRLWADRLPDRCRLRHTRRHDAAEEGAGTGGENRGLPAGGDPRQRPYDDAGSAGCVAGCADRELAGSLISRSTMKRQDCRVRATTVQ